MFAATGKRRGMRSRKNFRKSIKQAGLLSDIDNVRNNKEACGARHRRTYCFARMLVAITYRQLLRVCRFLFKKPDGFLINNK